MNPWLIGAVVLMIGAIVPAALLGSRGEAPARLVGLEMTGSVLVLTLVLLTQAYRNSSFLTVPLVLVLLSVAGTLVFTRLMAPRR
jgi:multisubunit Na+/H+ antiporter MnhF subunit